jgi:hypothetical protein
MNEERDAEIIMFSSEPLMDDAELEIFIDKRREAREKICMALAIPPETLKRLRDRQGNV